MQEHAYVWFSPNDVHSVLSTQTDPNDAWFGRNVRRRLKHAATCVKLKKVTQLTDFLYFTLNKKKLMIFVFYQHQC